MKDNLNQGTAGTLSIHSDSSLMILLGQLGTTVEKTYYFGCRQ